MRQDDGRPRSRAWGLNAAFTYSEVRTLESGCGWINTLRYSKSNQRLQKELFSIRRICMRGENTTNSWKPFCCPGADNDAAMETQLQLRQCPLPKWARGGAPRPSAERHSWADYPSAWEHAGSLNALKMSGGFIVFLANRILAELALNESGRTCKRKKPGKCPGNSVSFQVSP